jgi:hypothetical protein
LGKLTFFIYLCFVDILKMFINNNY